MSSLTSTFSAASFQEKPSDSFLTWFLIFLFLEITDSREEKRRKEKERERRLRIDAQNEALRIKKLRQSFVFCSGQSLPDGALQNPFSLLLSFFT